MKFLAKIRRCIGVGGFSLWIIALTSQPAWAYLDPGTGSIILQVLLGGFAGALVIVKLYWHRVKSFFGHGNDGEAANEENSKL